MSLNWSSIGSTLGGLTSALSAAGLTPGTASFQTAVQTIGGLISSNPNQAAELQICGQLLQFAGNPQLEEKLAMDLAAEQGIPAAAATLALTLTQPGVDIPTRVLQIEQIIKGN